MGGPPAYRAVFFSPLLDNPRRAGVSFVNCAWLLHLLLSSLRGLCKKRMISVKRHLPHTKAYMPPYCSGDSVSLTLQRRVRLRLCRVQDFDTANFPAPVLSNGCMKLYWQCKSASHAGRTISRTFDAPTKQPGFPGCPSLAPVSLIFASSFGIWDQCDRSQAANCSC